MQNIKRKKKMDKNKRNRKKKYQKEPKYMLRGQKTRNDFYSRQSQSKEEKKNKQFN